MSLNLAYRVGIKRQVINALKAVYLDPNFPDIDLANKINIELEYPIIQERYPAIYVSWQEKSVYDAGLGHYTLEKDFDTGVTNLFRHWIFEGAAILNIMALDPLERDTIAASLADILAFRNDDILFQKFRDELYDEEFVSLQLLLSSMIPGGEEQVPAPWENKNEFVYLTNYTISGVGSFFSNPITSGLIEIGQINFFPYRPDQNIPTGSLDPKDVKIPWINQ